MSKYQESAKFMCSDQTTRRLTLLLLSITVALTVAVCRYVMRPSARDNGPTPLSTAVKVVPSPQPSIKCTGEPEERPLTCPNCRAATGIQKLYPCTGPTKTTIECKACGITSEYTNEYLHSLTVRCGHARSGYHTSTVQFPCLPGNKQTKPYQCVFGFGHSVSYQCRH